LRASRWLRAFGSVTWFYPSLPSTFLLILCRYARPLRWPLSFSCYAFSIIDGCADPQSYLMAVVRPESSDSGDSGNYGRTRTVGAAIGSGAWRPSGLRRRFAGSYVPSSSQGHSRPLRSVAFYKRVFGERFVLLIANISGTSGDWTKRWLRIPSSKKTWASVNGPDLAALGDTDVSECFVRLPAGTIDRPAANNVTAVPSPEAFCCGNIDPDIGPRGLPPARNRSCRWIRFFACALVLHILVRCREHALVLKVPKPSSNSSTRPNRIAN